MNNSANLGFHIILITVCPGSSDPFYIITYYIKWVTISWTHNTIPGNNFVGRWVGHVDPSVGGGLHPLSVDHILYGGRDAAPGVAQVARSQHHRRR